MKKFLQYIALILIFNIHSSFATIKPELVELAKNSIVTINTRASLAAYNMNGSWSGTGFIANKKSGYVITNAHVTGHSTVGNMAITFFNGRQIEAKLVYRDRWQDFAILQIDPKEIPKECTEIEFSKEDPKLSDHIFLVGNNEAQAFSFHEGYISNLYTVEGEMPQHSYTINLNTAGGSSGSPVMDMKGKAIGLNYGGGKTYALALKANYITDVLSALAKGEQPVRQHTGIYTTTYSLDKAVKHRGFPKEKMHEYIDKYPEFRNNCLVILTVIPGTPAEGVLKADDILWKVDGELIGASLYKLDAAMNKAKGLIKLDIYRDGKLMQVEVKTYNALKTQVNRMVSFGGATFFEADEFISAISGVPMKSLFVEDIQPGSTLSIIPTQLNFNKAIYRFVPLKIGSYPIKTLDELITYLPKIAKEKYTTLTLKNYIPFYWPYNQVFFSNQTEYKVDIKFEDIDTSAKLYEFDQKTLEWKATDINLAG
jgi:S1-C subfamily serine protease